MKISRDFRNAFVGGGSYCSVDCKCGITHFVLKGCWASGDYEDGEYENLLEMQKEDPDKVISHTDTIDFGYIGNECFVIGCPCNSLKRYEDWLLQNRHWIVNYFNYRASSLKSESENTTINQTIDKNK